MNTPLPPFLTLPTPAPRRVLAVGAWLKNAAGLLQGSRFQFSALHGDLSSPQACAALDASLHALVALANGPIEAVAHDLHPDFHSTRLALQWAQRLGVPAIGVQHHHAHLAVVQAQHGWEGAVIGLALDGVGLGTDGRAWGGELLLSTLHAPPPVSASTAPATTAETFERLAHLPALALPGGDVAAREPWRLAAAVLHDLGRAEEIEPRLGPHVGSLAANTVRQLLDRGLNCPISTSAGRWFDAAAGILGLSLRQREEAEAAMALERCAADWLARHPDPVACLSNPDDPLDLRPLMTELLALDPQDPDAQGHGAALFHVTLATALASATVRHARARGVQRVALGGGCLFNRLLSERLEQQLHAAGLLTARPLAPVSCGDAGLALGQAWCVATRPLSAAPPDPSTPDFFASET